MTNHAAPDPSIPANSDTPAWKRLISPSLTSSEVISLVEAVANKEEVKVICGLVEDDAQAVINKMHGALDLPSLSPRLRWISLSALSRICSGKALLPSSLQIPICYNHSSDPLVRDLSSDVWKGEHNDRHVTVKLFRICPSKIAEFKTELYKKVVRWNALRHPNVLPVLGIMTDEHRFAMVSEWMVNGNINEYLKTHRKANPLKLLQEVARGLIYLHNQKIIHGDLKGLNILIDQDGHARLTDFGLAPIVWRHILADFALEVSTLSTILLADPEFFDPQPRGPDNDGGPTKASDCYAFGMVIYEVLTGHPPFASFDLRVIMHKVRNGEHPERPGGVKGMWLTDDLWKMLGRCWAREAKNRPSIETVCKCLEQVAGIWKPPAPQANEDVDLEKDPDVTALIAEIP